MDIPFFIPKGNFKMDENGLTLNTIYTEDCLITLGRMPDRFVTDVFTSPPYNRKRNDKYAHYDDMLDDYFGFLVRFTDECVRVAKRYVIVNIQPNFYNRWDVYKYVGHYSNSILDIVTWTKTNPRPNPSRLTSSYEWIIVIGNEKPVFKEKYVKNHISTSVAKMPTSHKAVMHNDVASWYFKHFTTKGDTIYDPFMGTGTTAYHAIVNGCSYIGSEISEEYVALSRDKLKIIQGVLL